MYYVTSAATYYWAEASYYWSETTDVEPELIDFYAAVNWVVKELIYVVATATVDYAVFSYVVIEDTYA